MPKRAALATVVLTLTATLGTPTQALAAPHPATAASTTQSDLSTPATTRTRAKVRTVTYPGQGKTVHLGTVSRLKGTSPAFRRFVTATLNDLWQQAGGSAKCRTAPQVTIKTWRSDGFAFASNVGTFAPCPSGGYFAYVVRTAGPWRSPAALASQDALYCSDLKSYRVPAALVRSSCLDDRGEFRRYRGFRLAKTFHTPRYAARALVAAIPGSVGAAHWADAAVVNELLRRRDDGASITVRDCFGADDPERGAYLDGARRGCTIDVFYAADSYRVLYALSLSPTAQKRFYGSSLNSYASS